MKPKRLLLLLCVLVLASWWMVSQQSKQEPSSNHYPKPETPLFSFQEQELHRIVVFRQASQLILQLVKVNDLHWLMKDPVTDRADFALIRQAIFQILAAGQFPPEPSWTGKSDANLGLNPPKMTLEFYSSHHPNVLRVGAKSLDGQHYVAEIDGQRCRIPVNLISWFDRDEHLWRDHGLLRAPSSVLSMQWNPVEGPEVSLFKGAEGWQITAPKQGLLKSNLVGSLMRLFGARIDSLPQDPLTEEGVMAVKRNAGRLAITYAKEALEGGAKNQVFWVTPNFVIEESRKFHLPVRPDSLQFLSHDPANLFSQKFLNLQKSHLSSVGIKTTQESKIFRRFKGNWKLSGIEKTDPQASQAMVLLLAQIFLAQSLPEKRPLHSSADFTLRLSISARPDAPGSVLLNAWHTADGILLENTDSGLCTLLPKENLQDFAR